LFDAFSDRSFRYDLAKLLCGFTITAVTYLISKIFVSGSGRHQCTTQRVIDHLASKGSQRSIDAQPRTRSRSTHSLTNAISTALTLSIYNFSNIHS
jgi:hypothetical protein